MLYIVGTPIGNILDISYRAVQVLESAEVIFAEDTRHSLKLLNHFDIKKKLISYNEFNQDGRNNIIGEYLAKGLDVAIVSDAGMPLISDPGANIIDFCYKNNYAVTTIPAGTALISGLILSSFSCRSFVFEGFLPSNKKARTQVVNKFVNEERPVVLYCAPHDLKETLKFLFDNLGDREVAVVKEITKMYENASIKSLSEHLAFYDNNEPKGEFVLVINGSEIIEEELTDYDIIKRYESILATCNNKMQAIKTTSKELGIAKNIVYDIVNK